MPSAAFVGGVRDGMRLVDDDEFGGGAQELVAPPLRLDEVGRDDDEGIALEDRFAHVQIAFQPGRRAGQHQLGVDVELVAQFGLPLLGQLRRTEHGQPLNLAAVEQFAGNQQRLHRLADADIIGDQQAHGVELERHQEWDELIGARLDIDAGERPKRSGTGAKPEPDSRAQQPC